MDLDRLVVALGCPSASVCLRRSTVEDPMKRPTSAGYELSEELQKLLVRVREAIRMRQYSLRTEQAYVQWIRRYIFFHKLNCIRWDQDPSLGKVHQCCSAGQWRLEDRSGNLEQRLKRPERCRQGGWGSVRLRTRGEHPEGRARPPNKELKLRPVNFGASQLDSSVRRPERTESRPR